jgi:hypothetical protein
MIASLLLAAALCLQGAPEILEQRCVNCHDAKKHKGGLDLSTREGLLRGGDGGAAVVPGKAAESLLYKVVARQQEPFMPQKSERLSDDEVRRIAEWIDAGTPYPRTLVSRTAETTHWAFTPLARAAAGKGIDDFIDDALRAKGLTPAPAADPVSIPDLHATMLHLLGLDHKRLTWLHNGRRFRLRDVSGEPIRRILA